jgi:glycosyltransferase involved in cell wall biosynthesis
VLPSDNEPWGLVVNEVMCAGIPVIVSDEVGCVPDLVKDGVNGYQMKAGDIPSLAAAIEKLLADEHRRKRMGAASRFMIREWGYEQCRQGMTAALEGTVRRG